MVSLASVYENWGWTVSLLPTGPHGLPHVIPPPQQNTEAILWAASFSPR